MASGEEGDGWDRPSDAPAGMPRFVPPGAPTAGPAGPQLPYPLPPRAPVAPDADPRYPAQTAPGWGSHPIWAPEPDLAPVDGGAGMTRGWAWAAFTLLLLIPVGWGLSIAWVVIHEITYESDPENMEEWWVLGFAIVAAFLWTVACGVAALVSAIIGTVRSRRHPEIRRAPVLTVLVWIGVGVLALPVVLSIVSGFS